MAKHFRAMSVPYHFAHVSSSSLYYYSLVASSFSVQLAYADLCMSPISTSSTDTDLMLSPDSILAKPTKSCPDFKDGPEQKACCPSQINQGAFFCCSEEHKTQLEAELASEARRQFFSSHVPELVLCSLGLLLVLVLLLAYLCRRSRFCPLLHRRKSGGGSAARRRSSGVSLDSADYLCVARTHLQQQHFLQHPAAGTSHRPATHHRPFPVPPRHTLPVQTFNCGVVEVSPKSIPDAPPPYEEFVRVPPPPPQRAPPILTREEDEELQNILNSERERELRDW